MGKWCQCWQYCTFIIGKISGSAVKYAHLNKVCNEMYPHQRLQDRELRNLFKKQSISRFCGDCTDWMGESDPQRTTLSISPPLIVHLLAPLQQLCCGLFIQRLEKKGYDKHFLLIIHSIKKQFKPLMKTLLSHKKPHTAAATRNICRNNIQTRFTAFT